MPVAKFFANPIRMLGKVNHSTPRPKGRGLLEVHPERRLQPRLERRGFAPSNG
jgi:hypothetical protein